MKKIKFAPKKDFLERLSSAGSIKAVSELIWNGLDAGSSRVDVELGLNGLNGIESIRVKDDGTGIYYPDLDSLFGDLGASWKREKRRVHGRAIHGKKGQGRLKAFSLGNDVRWRSVYEDNSKIYSYTIHGRMHELENMVSSDPVELQETIPCGTEVVITAIEKSHGALIAETASTELSKIFAPYLRQYPDVSIYYDGQKLDPEEYQLCLKDIDLEPITLSDGTIISASLTILEWTIETKRAIHLCDAKGVSLHETSAVSHIKAPGFNFTAYIKSDHFEKLDVEGKLILDDLHPDVNQILKESKKVIRKYFRKRLAEKQKDSVERWKEEEIYPYEDKSYVEPIEEIERQVFDILAINVESYLPVFDEADKRSRKFMFRLLAQALRHNPESVQSIITEVLNLKKEDQDDLAELIRHTPISKIISAAKTVANRLDFLTGLEQLLFDHETKPRLLERDQLHKILENEAWIFDEEFGLSGSEQRLEEVLEKHIGELGPREDGEMSVRVGEGKQGRIDLLLSKANQPHTGEFDYLIVELKRPTKKIDGEVIRQVKNYAKAVAGDERFSGIPATWKFLAVSNKLNDEAEDDANQQGQPRGRVWVNQDGSISVWVIEWAELINNARSRLGFINQSLDYKAGRESANEYLKKAHSRFIPDAVEENSEEGIA